MTGAMAADVAIWWLRAGLGDLAGARALLDLPGAAPRHAAYLAQQAAEKAIKATISLQGHEPPKTHDLILLLERSPVEADLRSIRVDIVALSGAQTVSRYPQLDEPPYDHGEAKLLVADAASLVEAAQRYFDACGFGETDLTPA